MPFDRKLCGSSPLDDLSPPTRDAGSEPRRISTSNCLCQSPGRNSLVPGSNPVLFGSEGGPLITGHFWRDKRITFTRRESVRCSRILRTFCQLSAHSLKL